MLQDTVHIEMSTIDVARKGRIREIDQSVTEADMPAPVFLAAKAVFDKAAADGWEELDIACVHDQLSGESSPGELA